MDALIQILIMLAQHRDHARHHPVHHRPAVRLQRHHRDNSFFVAVHDAIAAARAGAAARSGAIMPDTGAIDLSPMVLLLLIYAVLIVLEQPALI